MYLSWDEKIITDFSDDNIEAMYDHGYVFTRKGKGVMNQTRSLRIDLSKFELSSENRRILKKTEQLAMNNQRLPFQNYHWSIGKLAHDFYETKFGKGTFSANKVKELLTDPEKSNFNHVFVYSIEEKEIGYSIIYETPEIIHYSYPFYQLTTNKEQRTIEQWSNGTISNQQSTIPNIGLGMMLRAILYAKENGKKYIYLGSASRPTDTYKLQFAGIEWFDNIEWKQDTTELKSILNS